MLPNIGPATDIQNERRRVNMAAREAVSLVQSSLPMQRAAQSAGLSAIDQTDGQYDADGDWQHYLRCGDALDSAGCAP
jgi:hypothetical protein